jgi:hypothetical protein
MAVARIMHRQGGAAVSGGFFGFAFQLAGMALLGMLVIVPITSSAIAFVQTELP